MNEHIHPIFRPLLDQLAGGGASRMGRNESDRVASTPIGAPIPARQLIEDDDLTIDPREHIIEHFGHRQYYTTHFCPKCEEVSPCKSNLCRLASTIECLPCATHELLEDTERFSKEAREFLKTALPTDDQTLMWWRAVRSEIDGKLKGLAERAEEVLKREVNR